MKSVALSEPVIDVLGVPPVLPSVFIIFKAADITLSEVFKNLHSKDLSLVVGKILDPTIL